MVTVVDVQKLSKQYNQLTAVKGIDFTVERGEIFGLIGPDGAGKTTTFHILSGILEATGGQVEVLGKSPRNARSNLGYLTQQFSLYLDLSVVENLQYTAKLKQVSDRLFHQLRDKYLTLMNLEKFSHRLAGQLSGGMKQKLALCCALISQPEILLLDEPTTGVDPVSRREFWDILGAIAEEGKTIIVATPYLDEAERCHRLALMYEGTIQEIGTLSQLRENLGLQRLEIYTSQLFNVEAILSQAIHPESNLVDVQIFGDRLDILVKDAAIGARDIQDILQQHQLPLTHLEIVPPTLENVFVTRLKSLGNNPYFIPFPQEKIRPLHLASAAAIQAENINKNFGEFQAVKDVSLTIHYGEIYGLLGANGAGKTTIIKMLCGLLQSTSGIMILAGEKSNLRSSALRKRMGYMSQKFTLYDDLTIEENLQFYCGVYGVPHTRRQRKIHWVLETCGLLGKETLVTGQLPGGWKQRVAFGASVLHEPEILFLDEPTSGVDPSARRQFWRLINEFARQGTAILVTTHYLEEAEQCHHIGFMVAGSLVMQGSPSEIKASQPGQLIEIVIHPLQQASRLLKTQFHPWRVSIFGDRLHLVLDHPEAEIPLVYSLLEKANLPIQSLREIPFSLEDAFIGIVQRASLD